MAKKRRDDKRSTSTAKRVLKAGGTVLAIGAGAALFSRSGLLKKTNDIIPALRDTTRTFNKEMLNKKATAMNLYEAYNKTVGPRATVLKNTIKNQHDIIGKDGKKILTKKGKEVLNYRPSKTSMETFLGRNKHIRQVSNNISQKELIKKHLLETRKGIKKGFFINSF